jgi:hypothetical protein
MRFVTSNLPWASNIAVLVTCGCEAACRRPAPAYCGEYAPPRPTVSGEIFRCKSAWASPSSTFSVCEIGQDGKYRWIAIDEPSRHASTNTECYCWPFQTPLNPRPTSWSSALGSIDTIRRFREQVKACLCWGKKKAKLQG